MAAPAARIQSLDGVRGLAITMVLVMHYYVTLATPEGSAVHDALKRLFCLSYCGVDLFFVLSGYLIGGILLDQRESPRLLRVFYLRRFLRIIPLYALLLVTFFVCRHLPGLATLADGRYFESPVPLWTYFLMVQNVAMAWLLNVGPYWLGPTWSLAVEEQFYLIAPWFVRRFVRRDVAYFCVAAFILCPLVRLTAMIHGNNPLAAVFLLPMRVESLLGGVLCAIVVRSEAALAVVREHSRLLGGVMLALGTFVALLTSANLAASSPIMTSFGYTIVGLFCTGLVLWVVVFPAGGLARRFCFGPLRAIGWISYFVYLFHNPALYFVHAWLRHDAPAHFDRTSGGVTLVALAATLAFAAISWMFLESPLLKFGRRFSYA